MAGRGPEEKHWLQATTEGEVAGELISVQDTSAEGIKQTCEEVRIGDVGMPVLRRVLRANNY